MQTRSNYKFCLVSCPSSVKEGMRFLCLSRGGAEDYEVDLIGLCFHCLILSWTFLSGVSSFRNLIILSGEDSNNPVLKSVFQLLKLSRRVLLIESYVLLNHFMSLALCTMDPLEANLRRKGGWEGNIRATEEEMTASRKGRHRKICQADTV